VPGQLALANALGQLGALIEQHLGRRLVGARIFDLRGQVGHLGGAEVGVGGERDCPTGMERVDRLIARKYRLDMILIIPLYRLVQRLRGVRVGADEIALAISPA
jgi:hypothetical protein